MRYCSLIAKAVIGLLLTISFVGCKSGKPSNSVTFTSSKPAPQEFDVCIFEWARPRVEPGVNLEIEVLYPDGSAFYHENVPPFPAWNPEPSAKTEFSNETTNNSLDSFYGRDISVNIKVDKGFLIFSPDGFYSFNFYSGSGKTLIGTIPATMETK